MLWKEIRRAVRPIRTIFDGAAFGPQPARDSAGTDIWPSLRRSKPLKSKLSLRRLVAKSLRWDLCEFFVDFHLNFFSLDTPFAQWTSDDVVCWLHEMGLHQYVSEAQRWATRGQVMLDCPTADLEKELGVKHALHKKKLILALEAKGRSQDQAAPMPILPGKVHCLLAAFGKVLEQIWNNFGTNLELFWNKFGIILEQFWNTF